MFYTDLLHAIRALVGSMMGALVLLVVALGSLVGAFVIDEGGFVLYLVGMAISLVLMWLLVWPSRRTVQRTAAALDRLGGRSYLLELYGIDPWTGSEDEKPGARAVA